MNERIKEISHLASRLARKEHPEIAKGTNMFTWLFGGPKYKVFMITEYDHDKFAKLLIQECADVVSDAINHGEPVSTYATKIKKHFGVEE